MKNVYKVQMLALLVFFVSLPALAHVSGLPDFTGLVKKAGPAVVNIRVTQFGTRSRRSRNPNQDQNDPHGQNQPDIPEFFRRYFNIPNDPRFGGNQPDRMAAGSGFIFRPDGYILTNHHVIENADQIVVRLADHREFKAKLIGSDEASDIAVIKIDAGGPLPVLKMGDSDKLQPGQWVVAIGSPFNFDQSVTAGIVSAKGRSNGAQQYVPFIQSDVAINRGNSGGPLLNMDGDVVGINSWILSSSGGYIGLSFSIPIEVAARTAKQLVEKGKVERGLLGVVVGAVSREMAEALGLDRPVGALVNDVTAGGSADRAGIEPGDVILNFNGTDVETWSDLPPLVGETAPGTKTTVKVSRDGKEKTFTVTLDTLDSDNGTSLSANGKEQIRSNSLGLEVEEITQDRRRELGDPEGGVVITNVESDNAWRAGLRPGDVILMVNNRNVKTIDDFKALVKDIKPDKAVALRVWRNGTSSFIANTPGSDDDKGKDKG